MKATQKRVWSILLALMMLVSILGSVIVLPVQAATVDYVYSGNYIYNWGERDELATFLSPNAVKFYSDNGVTYDQLASLPGSSTNSSVPDSALFKSLHTLMYENLDNPTSYDATRDLFKYTDCENNGGSISSFYSGKAIGPAWDSGKTWNREHCWPNSKSNGGSDSNTQRETDIMMLRPASVSENSSRSNTAYGEGAKFYDPNELGQNVRGDAARIVLYVYVCWGGSDKHDGALNYMWGSSGVMESKDVLLKWMEEDPVDTWEMGRNDSVEAITGTRNVFVDYPELAFCLFDEEVPADYDSPSGEKTPAVTHDYKATVTVTPTCDKAGERTYTCTECGDSYTEAIPATGHKMVNGVCSVCGVKKLNVSFKLGTNGNASHQDGTSNTSYTETVDGYTLNIVSGVKMFTTAIDAKGNSCIKLGTSSAVGSFSFTVPDEVTSVVIHIAKYKANATKVKINGVEYTINGSSNDGQYDAIEVDTSSTKTVSVDTVSGGARAMVNTIDYVMAETCAHTYTDDFDVDCNVCGAVRQLNFDIFSDNVTNSRMEMDNDEGGLAFSFNASVSGVEKKKDNSAVWDNATVVIDGSEYRVIGMGAVVTNNEAMGTDPEQMIRKNADLSDQSLDIEAVYMYDVKAENCTYAVRIINIPPIGFDNVVYARPYYVVEHNGKEITLYEEIASATYNG